MARLRKQYHIRKSPNGFYAWDVDRLVELSADLPVQPVALADIAEIDENYWFQEDGQVPSCRAIVDHFRLVGQVELEFPIILCADGRLMDGMHRVAKALLEGRQTIDAVRLLKTPDPDYVDISPDELPY